jgi:hypothetical protein
MRFTIKTARTRLETVGDPMAAVLREGIDMAAALAKLDRHAASAPKRRRT